MADQKDLKKKLEAATYESLDAMMAAYADAAVEIARREHRQKLDFSVESVDALDMILTGFSDELMMLPEAEREGPGEFAVRLWGSYLGEVLRRRYAGAWEMTPYPGGMTSVPAIDVRGSRLFPLMKVYRRLTIGEGEDLPSFLSMAVGRLGQPARVN